MRYTTLLKTDLKPSVICLGSADMGSKIDLASSFQMLDAFVEQGGNFLDTAAVYANWLPGERNISEKTLGKWLKERGTREQMIVATKGAHPELSTMHISRMAPADIQHDIDTSLKNLQTEIIDLYWLHRDDPKRSVQEIIDTLNSQVQAGKIRHFGASNWQTGRLKAANDYAEAHGIQGFVANQPLWNIGVIDFAAIGDPTLAMMDKTMWQYHKKTGLAAIPYSSQANGLFNKLAQGRSDTIKPNTLRIYPNPQNQQRFQRIQQLMQETGFSATQIVLGYLISQPFATIPIVGCQNMGQLQDSLTAGDVQLSPEQLKLLESH
ncbi:MAG: aldo/keto reductase [Chloroflexi bacterium]|nr:aldo/keto reductase [Chloroflexota bacterium]